MFLLYGNHFISCCLDEGTQVDNPFPPNAPFYSRRGIKMKHWEEKS